MSTVSDSDADGDEDGDEDGTRRAPAGPTPGFLVWRLSMKWRVAVDRALTPLGLTHAQFSLVGSLYDLQSTGALPSQRRLADHTGLEPLYVSKLARTLEAGGLLTRTPDPADSRAVRLSLTDEGRNVTERAVVVVRNLMDHLLDPLGGLTGAQTAAFTRRLTDLLDVPLAAPLDAPPAPPSHPKDLPKEQP